MPLKKYYHTTTGLNWHYISIPCAENNGLVEFMPPRHLEKYYHALGITAPDMPVPVTMLCMLWQLVSVKCALLDFHMVHALCL
mgnify:CR=1 FL=1